MISFKYNHKKTEQSSSCKTLRTKRGTENRPRSTSPPPRVIKSSTHHAWLSEIVCVQYLPGVFAGSGNGIVLGTKFLLCYYIPGITGTKHTDRLRSVPRRQPKTSFFPRPLGNPTTTLALSGGKTQIPSESPFLAA